MSKIYQNTGKCLVTSLSDTGHAGNDFKAVFIALQRFIAHVRSMSLSDNHHFDLAIIGGGSGGYAAARTAAGAGLKVGVIEGGREVGGLCILRGCMPTKALLYAAEVLHLASHPEPWGIRAGAVGFDFARVMARKDALVAEFAEYRKRQLADGRFAFLRANARFADPHTLALDNSKTVTARHFVVATGSSVAPAPLPELRETGYLTSDEALSLSQLPESLIVLGGGPIACEFAQFFARFGVKVSLVQRSGHLLREFDPDAAAVIEAVFRREGVDVFTGTTLTGARRDGKLKTVTFEQGGKSQSVSASEILCALGRTPNTASLNLDAAGVATDRGRIIANDFMQTSAPHIYAAGDCAGPHEIVHIAIQQGEAAAHNIAARTAPHGWTTGC